MLYSSEWVSKICGQFEAWKMSDLQGLISDEQAWICMLIWISWIFRGRLDISNRPSCFPFSLVHLKHPFTIFWHLTGPLPGPVWHGAREDFWWTGETRCNRESKAPVSLRRGTAADGVQATEHGPVTTARAAKKHYPGSEGVHLQLETLPGVSWNRHLTQQPAIKP